MKDWYCVKTKVKQERVAFAVLTEELGVESYLPMIPSRRRRKPGMKTTLEPMFPGYLFAKADLQTEMRKVGYARGVSGFVHLGDRFPKLEQEVIDDLEKFCASMMEEAESTPVLNVGDSVELVSQMFDGTPGVVSELMSAKNRVKVLVEFLNRSIEVEMSVFDVSKKD
ncbi:MAG: transcription termination/antitermination NusG family protein [Verrucomicrobiota bacterium]